MARHVTISCLTAPALPVPHGASPDQVIALEIAHWTQRLEAVLPDCPDLIVLPEAADRPLVAGFDSRRQREYYNHRGAAMSEWFAQLAREHSCNIAYSSQRLEEGIARNRTEYLNRNGTIVGSYDKNHLVIAENEVTGLEYGAQIGVVDLDFGRVGTAICFDLNFDELLTRYRGLGVELMVFSSEYHGGLMQNYWAYNLRSYFAGSIRPPAPSAIISPLGETMAESTNYFPHVTQRINLDYAVAHLDDNWAKLDALKAKYGRDVKVHDPGRLGSVLITAESSNLSVRDLIAEFEIELLDDYLERSRTHRAKRVNEQGTTGAK